MISSIGATWDFVFAFFVQWSKSVVTTSTAANLDKTHAAVNGRFAFISMLNDCAITKARLPLPAEMPFTLSVFHGLRRAGTVPDLSIPPIVSYKYCPFQGHPPRIISGNALRFCG